MDQLMVSFQCWAGSADEDINLFLVGGKNYDSWQLHEGHHGEIDGLGSKIGPASTRIPNESPHQGLSIGEIIMRGFHCKMILY